MLRRIIVKGAGLLLGCVTLCGLVPNECQAQDMQSSPLSRYGYGVLTDRSPVAWRGMGNVGIGMSSNKTINLKNPAAYAATDSLSFLLDIGLSMNMGHYKDSGTQKSSFLGGLDYIAVQLPLFRDRTAVSLGIVPFSRAGYGLSTISKVENGRSESSQVLQTYRGFGSVQSAYFGLGQRIFEGFSLGANVHYIFGNLTHAYNATPTDVYGNITQASYNIRMNSVSFDLGAQYSILLDKKKKDRLLIGVTYTPQVKMTPQLSYTVNRSTSTSTNPGTSVVRPNITSTTASPTTALPQHIGAGFSWNRAEKYKVALDFSTAMWEKIPNIFSNDGVRFRNTYNVGAGVEILPDNYSRSYGQRVSYRFGVNYGTSYLNLDKLGQIQTIGASVGFGLPLNLFMSERQSTINLALEYLHTMPQQSKIFSENMIKFSMAITFNETWFKKLKIY